MYNSFITLSLAGLLAVSTAAPVALEARATGKRGLAYNSGALTKLFSIPNSKVSWMYNWASSTSGAQSSYEYVPLLHGNDAKYTGPWGTDVAAAYKAGSRHVMSFNEPDQCGDPNSGGSCIQDVNVALKAHKDFVQPLAGQYKDIKIGAPSVTNGVKDAKTGADMGIPYLKKFLAGCKADCQIDFISIHWYDDAKNVDYFKQHIQDASDASLAAYGKRLPVWVTEFAPNGDDNAKQQFLKTVLPWMDSNPVVERYSYQWVTPNVLVNAAGNALSPLGNVFATT